MLAGIEADGEAELARERLQGRAPVLAGALIASIALLLMALLGWLAWAQVDEVVHAAGAVEPAGRVKIVNHPRGGRVAAIAVENDVTENLVAIVEVKQRDDEDQSERLDDVKHELARAIWKSHSLRVGDLVLVSPGSIPITTSGKIRRSSCAELYREGEFQRLDVPV